MSQKKQSNPEFSVEQELQIDAVCVDFETKLLGGDNPSIEEAIAEFSKPLRDELLKQLLLLEFEHTCFLETDTGLLAYRQRFPDDLTVIEQAITEHEGSLRSAATTELNCPSARPSRQEIGRMVTSCDTDLADGQTTASQGTWPVARYAVQDEVARGGMGSIHRVWDYVLNRTLAMKVMFDSPRYVDADTSVDMLNRFTNEAQVTAQLDHPGVVAVHDLGLDAQGRPFFTMKLVNGRNYSKIVELVQKHDEGWNLSRAIGVLVKVCQTVAYAHSRGVIHRDIKPANIMVGRFGEVYVMDWGLSKVAVSDDIPRPAFRNEHAESSDGRSDGPDELESALRSPVATLDGTVVGTPAFMSPEQARGEVDAVDQFSDIYSLGCVLYYVLTGSPPYVAGEEKLTPKALLARIAAGPPQPVAILSPQAPSELIAICEKAMNRHKADRYASAVDLSEDLQAWLDRRVVRAYRSDPIARIKSWVQRNQFAALAGTLALASLLFAVGWWAHQEREKATYLQLQLARQYLRQAQALCQDHRASEGLHLFVNAFTTCPREYDLLQRDITANLFSWAERSNQLVQMVDHEGAKSEQSFISSTPLPLAFGPASRHLITGGWIDNTARIWSLETGKPIGVPMTHQSPVVAVYCTRTSGRIVTHSRDGAVRLWSESGEPIQVIVPREAVRIEFNLPTSRVAVATADGLIRVWSAETGQQVGGDFAGEAPVSSLALSDDGARLIAGFDDWSIREWAIETGELVGSSLDGLRGAPVALSRSAKHCFALDGKGAAFLYNTQSPESPVRLNWGKTNMTCAAFSPDGSLLAVGSRGSDSLHVFSTSDGTRVRTRIYVGETVQTLLFSPDSQQLIVGSHDSVLRTWSMATGFQVGQEIKTRGPVHATCFSRDGSMLALGTNGVAEVWSVLENDVSESLKTGSAVWGIDFSPNGDTIATCDTNGRVSLWSAQSGELRHSLSTEFWLWDTAICPDSQHVVAVGNKGGLWWNPQGNEHTIQFLNDQSIRAVDVGRSGKLVATAGFDGRAIVWSVPEFHDVISFDHPANVEDVAFGPDERILVTACGDGLTRFWSLQTGEQVYAPLVHNDAVLAVRLSPDRRFVATGSRDRTTRLWKLDDDTGAVRILQHDHWVEDLAFLDEGRFLVTACRNGKAQIWSVDTGERIGAPFEHGGAVRAIASFGDQVVTGTTAPVAHRWRLHAKPKISRTDYDEWVQRVTGCRMKPIGVVSHLSPNEWDALGGRTDERNALVDPRD